MEEMILDYCRQDLHRFSKMTDMQIYEWMCWNFATKDYQMLWKCSIIIFEKSRCFRKGRKV